jgi:DNA repair exonuclease SbcCD ATPase subunit
MPDTSAKLKLPNIRKVSLRRFSLFAANPDAEFSCDKRVLCLVGANGVGKSTLLSAINFCLTGIVSDPSRSFESMEEYYKYTKGYAAGYFRGRINGTDEEDAEIALNFSIGNFDYEVRRGMFEPEELRTLSITNTRTNELVSETDEMPPGERHRLYMTSLVEHIGLGSFEEWLCAGI